MRKDLFINGKWVEAKTYSTLYAPYNNNKIAEVASATEEEVEQAIHAAFQAREIIADMPAHQRAEILESVATILTDRAEEAARIIAEEAAKPIKTAKAEVSRTIATYKFSAEEAKRIYGETIPLDAAPGGENRTAYTVREPLGVIGAITPFNFPMNLVAHKVGPAIAAGNTVVLKPARQTPLSSLFIAEIFQEAGLPAGVLNVVTGSGSVVGEKLVSDERVKKISFTGSPEVGIGIRNKAGLKHVTLELGSNSALIVDDGVDIDKIIDRCVTGAFAYQGQVCISLQRVYVHQNLYDEFVEKMVQATGRLNLGDPLDPKTDVSALISPSDVKRSLSWLTEAKEEGAKVAIGGIAEGNILHPTILTGVSSNSKLSCQEAFAPIVAINKVDSIEEAIDEVNNSRYGLQAGVYTNNIHTAFHVTKKLHVGGVLVNDIPTFRVDHMPYGGVKESGTGREGVKYAIQEMTEQKLIVFNQNV